MAWELERGHTFGHDTEQEVVAAEFVCWEAEDKNEKYVLG